MNTPQAAQRLLDAIAAALPYAPHRAEFDIVADAADDLRAALKRKEEAPTQETDMTTLRKAAQQALEALWHYHATEWGADSPASKAINALQAALKREEEALAWLEERKRHWRRELDRMRSPQ